LCYDSTHCRVVEEGCFGKTIKRNKKSIMKQSTQTKVGVALEAHEREGIGGHNS